MFHSPSERSAFRMRKRSTGRSAARRSCAVTSWASNIASDALIPASIPTELREELGLHLERSLFAFATGLRDSTVEGLPLPEHVTLADLAVPSPACGDWELWGGVSLRCLEHETRLRELNAERTRLLNERGTEIEERQRQVEELPIQRRRMNQSIAELQSLESEKSAGSFA